MRQLNFRERGGLSVLDRMNKTSSEMRKITKYADENFMAINKAKTKVMMINSRRRNIDFLPEVKLREDTLEVIDETKRSG